MPRLQPVAAESTSEIRLDTERTNLPKNEVGSASPETGLSELVVLEYLVNQNLGLFEKKRALNSVLPPQQKDAPTTPLPSHIRHNTRYNTTHHRGWLKKRSLSILLSLQLASLLIYNQEDVF